VVPLRVVPEYVAAKFHTLVPWQYPLIVPDLELPPIVYLLKAAFKFNVGEVVEVDEDAGEELSPPPPQAVNIAAATRDKPNLKLALVNINEVVAFDVIFN
jgi:hypothetical protein